jgi:hypothetical protein
MMSHAVEDEGVDETLGLDDESGAVDDEAALTSPPGFTDDELEVTTDVELETTFARF